jgi:hypothetical protein
LNGGTQVLTAAHCVAEGTGGALNTNGSSITFYVAGGPVSITGASIAVNPGWNGDATAGNDLAIITLSTPAVGVQTYGLYTGSDELGKVGVKAGFGKTGTGATGDTGASGTEHTGQNLYDAYSSIFNVVPGFGPAPVGAGLAYDFDNGLAANDAFGFFFGLNNPDTALVNANQEVMAAPGDSGGPTFIDGLIAGITSYGLTLAFSNGSTSDINTTANDASYGEFGVDTRVSYYQDWIYSVVGYPAASIPEPGSGAALAAGILMLLRRRLKASSPL